MATAAYFTAELPPLPFNSNGGWSTNVINAHKLIDKSVKHALTILHQEDSDPLRFRIISENLVNNMVPILDSMHSDGVPREFVEECTAVTIGPLVYELEIAALSSEGVERNEVELLQPVTSLPTRTAGRPAKLIDTAYITEAMSSKRNITISTLARTLGVHRNTLSRQMKIQGLHKQFDNLSDEILDSITKTFKARKPNSGLRYLRGFMRTQGFRVQKDRVRWSLRRVDGLGQALRRYTAIKRRKYSVPRPNYLWHCDGHHKLIWWGIVIHGFIDGFCRTITGLRANTNNRASTVQDVFLNAVHEYGTPSRVRGDRGGENAKVSVWMIMHRGPGRASFMWGSSTRNTRIERLWVEVGTQFARRWRAFFSRLTSMHQLDRKNPAHLWLLHMLFLGSINDDCTEFQDMWNAHPISGKQTKDQSPADMRFCGQTAAGVYVEDPMDGIHPDVINRYYGVTGGPEIQRGSAQTGAGFLDEDEELFDDSDQAEHDTVEVLENQITEDQEHNIRHEPVRVARHHNPFPTTDDEVEFLNLLSMLTADNLIPFGYGVQAEEWDTENYPELEVINCGKRGQEIEVTLPRDIWLPRAVQWVQALDLMVRLKISNYGNLYDTESVPGSP